MEPYWSGFTSPIAFPVYTGAKGISTGTQYPAGYSTPLLDSGSSSSTNTESNSVSYITAVSSGTPSKSNPSQHRGSSAPIGPIVGGVIGGLVFISLIVGLIVYFAVIRRRRERRAGLGLGQGQGQPQQPPPGFPPGSQTYHSQYQYPQSQPMAPLYTAKEGAPQNPQTQQPLRHEVETQYNKPELDVSSQQPGKVYPSQHAELPGAGLPGIQSIQPEYVSGAHRPS